MPAQLTQQDVDAIAREFGAKPKRAAAEPPKGDLAAALSALVDQAIEARDTPESAGVDALAKSLAQAIKDMGQSLAAALAKLPAPQVAAAAAPNVTVQPAGVTVVPAPSRGYEVTVAGEPNGLTKTFTIKPI